MVYSQSREICIVGTFVFQTCQSHARVVPLFIRDLSRVSEWICVLLPANLSGRLGVHSLSSLDVLFVCLYLYFKLFLVFDFLALFALSVCYVCSLRYVALNPMRWDWLRKQKCVLLFFLLSTSFHQCTNTWLSIWSDCFDIVKVYFCFRWRWARCYRFVLTISSSVTFRFFWFQLFNGWFLNSGNEWATNSCSGGIFTDVLISVLNSLSALIIALALYRRVSGHVPLSECLFKDFMACSEWLNFYTIPTSSAELRTNPHERLALKPLFAQRNLQRPALHMLQKWTLNQRYTH